MDNHKPTHTPEPWRVRRAMNGDMDVVAGRSDFVATVGRLAKPDLDADEDDKLHADADRIVACVNACEGIADPAGALSHVRAYLASAYSWLREHHSGSARKAGEDILAAIKALSPKE